MIAYGAIDRIDNLQYPAVAGLQPINLRDACIAKNYYDRSMKALTIAWNEQKSSLEAARIATGS